MQRAIPAHWCVNVRARWSRIPFEFQVVEVGAVEVEVTDYSARGVDRALLALKRALMREGLFAALSRHVAYVKPSEAKRRKRELNLKRQAKSEQRQRDGRARTVSQ